MNTSSLPRPHPQWLLALSVVIVAMVFFGCTASPSVATTTKPAATSTIPGAAPASDALPTATTPPVAAATATPTSPTAPPPATPTATPIHIICCLTIVLVPSVHQVVNQVSLSGTSSGPVTATCPAGELALSGSWATNSSDGSGAIVFNSTRNGSGAWNVYVSHSGATLVNAYVNCLKNPPAGATVSEVWAGGLSVPANSYGTKFASCGSDTLVGGGFASNNGITLYNFSNSGSSWGGYAWNHTTSAAAFSFYAECLHSATGHSASTLASGSSGTTATCPANTMVSGGGFATSSNSVTSFTMSTNGNGWQVYTSSGSLNAYAMCLSFA